jgi:hypothetical protein
MPASVADALAEWHSQTRFTTGGELFCNGGGGRDSPATPMSSSAGGATCVSFLSRSSAALSCAWRASRSFIRASCSVRLRSVCVVQDWELGRRPLWMRAGDGFWR